MEARDWVIVLFLAYIIYCIYDMQAVLLRLESELTMLEAYLATQ